MFLLRLASRHPRRLPRQSSLFLFHPSVPHLRLLACTVLSLRLLRIGLVAHGMLARESSRTCECLVDVGRSGPSSFTLEATKNRRSGSRGREFHHDVEASGDVHDDVGRDGRLAAGTGHCHPDDTKLGLPGAVAALLRKVPSDHRARRRSYQEDQDTGRIRLRTVQS